jgi:GDP-L-fucose synthase
VLALSDYRIVVTGATGFLGRHLLPRLQQRAGANRVVGLSSRDYDLMDPVQVARMFDEQRPEVLVHLAAYSGGIGINRACPADFYYRNTLLTALAFQAAATRGVTKMIYPMGGCSYPAKAVSPVDESQMWEGFPQPDSAGYSAAKKLAIVASQSYRTQYGLNSIVVVPGNMYGEYDNFRESESHVIPAMVRRYYEAKQAGAEQIVMWGSGSPRRDFVYAGDVAAAMVDLLERYDESEPINISTGSSTSIRELAELIRELTGFPGEIVWDTSKPEGQAIRIYDVKKLNALGLTCPTPLPEGLEKTIRWLAANYDRRGDGIRL